MVQLACVVLLTLLYSLMEWIAIKWRYVQIEIFRMISIFVLLVKFMFAS